MRCAACNKILNDFESTRKYEGTQHYVDLCNGCFATVDIAATTRADLATEETIDVEYVECSTEEEEN